jgi:predicted nucleic acid-binding protein
MAMVIDASVALGWVFDDEHSPIAAAVVDLLADDVASVPAIWWFEVRSALLVNERKGRLTTKGFSASLRVLSNIPVDVDRSPDEDALLGLARRHRLTVYDAAYLELAVRHGVPLATLYGALAAAARAEGIALLGTA